MVVREAPARWATLRGTVVPELGCERGGRRGLSGPFFVRSAELNADLDAIKASGASWVSSAGHVSGDQGPRRFRHRPHRWNPHRRAVRSRPLAGWRVPTPRVPKTPSTPSATTRRRGSPTGRRRLPPGTRSNRPSSCAASWSPTPTVPRRSGAPRPRAYTGTAPGAVDRRTQARSSPTTCGFGAVGPASPDRSSSTSFGTPTPTAPPRGQPGTAHRERHAQAGVARLHCGPPPVAAAANPPSDRRS